MAAAPIHKPCRHFAVHGDREVLSCHTFYQSVIAMTDW